MRLSQWLLDNCAAVALHERRNRDRASESTTHPIEAARYTGTSREKSTQTRHKQGRDDNTAGSPQPRAKRSNGIVSSLAGEEGKELQGIRFRCDSGQRKRGKAFSAKTFALANKRTGKLSKGLSGRGLPPSIHWIEKGTTWHRIASRRLLAWSVVGGRSRLTKPRYARAVRHPGARRSRSC